MKFNKSEYIVTSKDNELLMKGSMSKENCYMWINSHLTTYVTSKVGVTKLRQHKYISEEVIRGDRKISHMILHYHTTHIYIWSQCKWKKCEIIEILCVKNEIEELIIDRSYNNDIFGMSNKMLGNSVQHVKSEVETSLRRKLTYFIIC